MVCFLFVFDEFCLKYECVFVIEVDFLDFSVVENVGEMFVNLDKKIDILINNVVV